jgi:aminoglycoside phosphotransferase (APT) family kinase protein
VPTRPAVIDWELTRFSDPAVELGYFVGCLLDRCLARVRAGSPAAWRARADVRVERLADALAPWWGAYREAAGSIVARRPSLSFLAMSHAGAAAIGQVAGRAHLTGELTARDWLILERARALLVDPLAAYDLLLRRERP